MTHSGCAFWKWNWTDQIWFLVCMFFVLEMLTLMFCIFVYVLLLWLISVTDTRLLDLIKWHFRWEYWTLNVLISHVCTCCKYYCFSKTCISPSKTETLFDISNLTFTRFFFVSLTLYGFPIWLIFYYCCNRFCSEKVNALLYCDVSTWWFITNISLVWYDYYSTFQTYWLLTNCKMMNCFLESWCYRMDL